MAAEKLPKFDDAATFVLNYNGPDLYVFYGLTFPATLTLKNIIKMKRSAEVFDFNAEPEVAWISLKFRNKEDAEEFWKEYVALMEKV